MAGKNSKTLWNGDSTAFLCRRLFALGVPHELPVVARGHAAELFEVADENGAGVEAAVFRDLLQGILGFDQLAAGVVDADGADGLGDALVGLLAENFGAAGGESGTMGVRFG